MNFIWINVPQVALVYSENPNSIYLTIQKLFKRQWRTFEKEFDISLVIESRTVFVYFVMKI